MWSEPGLPVVPGSDSTALGAKRPLQCQCVLVSGLEHIDSYQHGNGKVESGFRHRFHGVAKQR